MDLLAGLKTFLRVIETGSFTAVAREVATTQSSVARQIAQLESHFGVRLIHRTTRRLSLTDDGQRLVDHARQLIEDAEAMEQDLGATGRSVKGLVRVALPVSVGLYVAPMLPALLRQHPGLSVDLVLGDRLVDLIEDRIDLALRGGVIGDSSLVARRLGTFSPMVIASPDYLRRAGTPRRPEDLADHCCILQAHGPGSGVWRFADAYGGAIEVKVGGSLGVNDSETARRVVLAGHGIALMPGVQALDSLRDGTLVRLLRDYPTISVPLQIVYPSRRNQPLRTRVVMEFLIEHIQSVIEELQNVR